MKTVKTRLENRNTYTYTDAMGRRYTLRPGDKDPHTGEVITEDMIKLLHQMDDNEVHNNVKNSRAPLQDWEKPIIDDWKKNHPGERIPTRMNLSLEDAGDSSDGGEGDIEKGLIGKASMKAYLDGQESAEIERLHEVVEMLRPDQRELYRRVVIEEESMSDVASELGVDSSAIRHRMKSIKMFIKKNFEKVSDDPHVSSIFVA